MKKNLYSRKDFLTNTAQFAVAGAIGLTGLNLLSGNKAYAGKNSPKYVWPYPYSTLDPEEARLEAHHLYWNGMDCSSGVFGALVNKLSAALGAPWTEFPVEVLLFGRGGGAGWGSLCGALNGASALISLVVAKDPSTALINELWGWYTTEPMPTDAANAATYADQNYVGDLVQSVSGSPLCHPSVSQWCMIANKKVSDVERKERCARLAGDITAKTVEILNAYFDSTFVGTFSDPESNASCMTCHGSSMNNNVMTHMECVSCHPGDPHAASVIETGGMAIATTLEDPYPNPFNSESTIKFALTQKDKVRLEVYDLQGRLVKSLIDSDFMNAGTYSAEWNGVNNAGSQMPNGVYFIKMTTSSFMRTAKVILSK